MACTRDSDCNNGLQCDGTERCEAGFCEAGTAMACDDGVPCTLDVCDATTDACEYIPQNSRCSDDVFCRSSMTTASTSGASRMRNGVPVDVALNIEVNFNLR